jgi:hypothetical protein
MTNSFIESRSQLSSNTSSAIPFIPIIMYLTLPVTKQMWILQIQEIQLSLLLTPDSTMIAIFSSILNADFEMLMENEDALHKKLL